MPHFIPPTVLVTTLLKEMPSNGQVGIFSAPSGQGSTHYILIPPNILKERDLAQVANQIISELLAVQRLSQAEFTSEVCRQLVTKSLAPFVIEIRSNTNVLQEEIVQATRFLES